MLKTFFAAAVLGAVCFSESVAFICHGRLNGSQFNHNVPAHFQEIVLRARMLNAQEDLELAITISDGVTKTTEKFEAPGSSGTAYHNGAHLGLPNGGFYYLTYDLPVTEHSADHIFKGLFVYAHHGLGDENRIRARFSLQCSEV